MLTLRYRFSNRTTEVAPNSVRALGAIAYGCASADGADIDIAAPSLDDNGATVFEQWLDSNELIEGDCGALRYRHDRQLVFGAISLNENDFIGSAQRSPLQQATAAAYARIFALLERLGMPHLWRIWNFIPRINAIENGIERYRQFNIERQNTFSQSGRAIAGNVPAASAVGTADGCFAVYFLAGDVAPTAIENPRQVSAYCYPAEYGPSSPIFARANLVTASDAELLFISGTASIVGHRTLHAEDVRAQTRELLANIDHVLAASNEKSQRQRIAREDLTYKVYIRHAGDCTAVKAEIERWLGATPRAIYLRADICRADLLVEVEASAGHITEMLRA